MILEISLLYRGFRDSFSWYIFQCRRLRWIIFRSAISVALAQHLKSTYGVLSEIQLGNATLAYPSCFGLQKSLLTRSGLDGAQWNEETTSSSELIFLITWDAGILDARVLIDPFPRVIDFMVGRTGTTSEFGFPLFSFPSWACKTSPFCSI